MATITKAMNDKYDLIKYLTDLASKIPGVNQDFVLGNYKDDILAGKVPKFIRERIRTSMIVDTYIRKTPTDLQRTMMRQNYTEKQYEKMSQEISKNADRIQEILLSDPYLIIIMGRNYDGKMMDAFLEHIRGMKGDEPPGETAADRLLDQTQPGV